MADDPWAEFLPKTAPAADPWAEFVAPVTPAPAAPASRKPDVSTWGGYAADVARSVEAGADRGITGVLGLPADVLRGGQAALDWAQSYGQGRPFAEVQAENNAGAILPNETLERFGGAGLRRSLAESGVRPEYTPQTTAGEYARTATEFGTGATMFPGGSVARNVIGYGVVPGLASEAAGQATEGTAAEPWARAGAAIGTGLGVAGATRLPVAYRQSVDELNRLPPERLNEVLTGAQRRLDTAAETGFPLSTFNAIDDAAGGATGLSEIQRQAEGMGRLRGFYANMPEQVDRAAAARFDLLGPSTTNPATIGPQVSEAAQGAVAASPEGQAYASQAFGLRERSVTPEQAGQVIQRQMADTLDQREAVRRAQADVEYERARQAPETVGIERRIEVERPGEPVVTYPQGAPRFEPDAPAPLAPRAPAAAAPAPATGRPENFTRWLAQRGGIPLDAEARGQDLNRAYIPGLGTLARRNAPTWDQIRVRLAEEGWQPADWAASARDADVKDWVIDRVRQERMGQGRQVRMEDDATAAAGSRGQQADEYRYALQTAERQLDEALEGVGVSPRTLQPEVRSRALNALVSDPRLDPLDAYERVVGSMREPYQPYVKTPTIREEIPDVQFGQVNPLPALERIRELRRGVAGPARRDLVMVERELTGRNGQLELSVEKLHAVRRELDDKAAEARRAGRNNHAGALEQARIALDRQLKTVPEVAIADANFARNSIPLEPFAEGTPLGRITQRDRDTGRPQVPAEQVPTYFAGPTASRDLLENAPAGARQAHENSVLTRLVDTARRPDGDIDPQALRNVMRDGANVDVLRQLPDVRQRLEQFAASREALARLDRTLVGQLARRDQTTEQAVKTLFPDNPIAGNEGNVGQAVAQVASRNPTAARQLARSYYEGKFNAMPGNQERGKIRFSRIMTDNRAEAARDEAVLRALPNGDTIADGMRRFFEMLDASQRRAGVGSRTAYNAPWLEQMSKGGLASRAAAHVVTGAINLPRRTLARIDEWRLGQNMDQIARLIVDPDAVSAFRGLLNAQVNPVGPMARLVAIASRDVRDPSQ